MPTDKQDDWLPDFCRAPLIFAVMVLAELVVLIVLLQPGGGADSFFARLGTLSFFAQWLALLCAALLCLTRRYVSKLGRSQQLLVTALIVLLTTVAFSHLVFVLDQALRLNLTLPPERGLEFVLGISAITALVGAAGLRYWWIQMQWKRELRAQSEARVIALEARIRPHFLFNSMNTILSLIAIDPAKAERAVEDLSDLFRAALKHSAELQTLDNELELIERYLSIEKLRLGERLRVKIEVEPEARNAKLPGMVLQPLVENAVYHGIQPREDGGTVTLTARIQGAELRICVRNPLGPNAPKTSGNGIALNNIAERLSLLFGRNSALIVRRDGAEFLAQINLPLAF